MQVSKSSFSQEAEIYKSSEFAQKIGVSARTLRRWDEMGTFRAYRTPSGRPYYTSKHYIQYTHLGLGNLKEAKDNKKQMPNHVE
jgi:DNA-binding transcriptional MerR regulator